MFGVDVLTKVTGESEPANQTLPAPLAESIRNQPIAVSQVTTIPLDVIAEPAPADVVRLVAPETVQEFG